MKAAGLYWPLFIYFAARILANGYYVSSLSAAINTEFTVIVEQLLLVVLICQVVQSREDVYLCVKTIVDASGIIAIISIINMPTRISVSGRFAVTIQNGCDRSRVLGTAAAG